MVFRKDFYKAGRLTARPHYKTPAGDPLTGMQPLKLDSKRDGFIYVPKGYNGHAPACLAVLLHGAGGNAEHGLSLLRKYADKNNIILLAPASQTHSWDIIDTNAFGSDVVFIDQAISFVFDSFAVHPLHIAIGGFSDGASYALCIGLTNGDLFTHVIAFSPGFFYTVEHQGKPQVFISHGINDGILPITPCSRCIVPQLQNKGITVTYKEFDGEHEIPATISQAAVEWFIK